MAAPTVTYQFDIMLFEDEEEELEELIFLEDEAETEETMLLPIMYPVFRDTSVLPLVQTDPKAPERTRQHIDMTSAILNSLIMKRRLVKIKGLPARGDWDIGYSPATPANWPNPSPSTLGDAIDILAARIAGMVDLRTRVGYGPPPPGLGNPGDTYVDLETGGFWWNP